MVITWGLFASLTTNSFRSMLKTRDWAEAREVQAQTDDRLHNRCDGHVTPEHAVQLFCEFLLFKTIIYNTHRN